MPFTKSLDLTPKEQNRPGPHPIDLAILAMSHFQLRNKPEADQFKAQLEEAMKHEKFKDAPEGQRFGREVEELFASVGNKPAEKNQ